MARAQSEGERVIGEPTRLSGVTSGIQDGTLLATDVTVNYAGAPPLRDQSLASYANDNGDSGGSVYAGGIAKGINSGFQTLSNGTRRSIFTTIENALRECP